MSIITGEVEAKAKTGKSIMVNGVWYSAYSSATLDGVSKGDTVSFEEQVKGSFHNIKGKVSVGGSPVEGCTATGATVPAKVGLPIKLDRERSIIRQNALTNAREYVIYAKRANDNFNVDIDTPLIIEIAREFEAYTSGDADIAAAKKMVSEMEAE